MPVCNSTSTNYQVVQMQEAEATTTDNSADISVSSIRNTYETIGTAFFNAGKWIVTHPVQSIIASSMLFAIGLGAGLGIPALINASSKTSLGNLTLMNESSKTSLGNSTLMNESSKTSLGNSTLMNESSKNTINCSELGMLSFGANQGANFSFLSAKDGNVLTEFLATESTRIDLNMTGLCKKPEGILSDSFLVNCNGVNVQFQPTELNQETIKKKLNGTECNLGINHDLIFKGELNPAYKSTMELDNEKMCDEEKIKSFHCKGYIEHKNSHLHMTRIDSVIAVFDKLERAANNCAYHINTKAHCKETINQQFVLVCGNNKYFFTPMLNLTASNVAKLNFGDCTITEQGKFTNAKTCKLWLGAPTNDFLSLDDEYKMTCKA